jgi:hypothetical protein
MLQGDTKPIRRLIEARFDEIKAITEGGGSSSGAGAGAVLPAAMSGWLQEVTWVCREEVRACPAYVHRRVAPLMAVLQQQQQQQGRGVAVRA